MAGNKLLWSGIGAALLAGGVAEARTVVLRASGPSAAQFRAGQVLREPVKLVLKRGDTLTVIDDQGTREFRGPAKIDDTAPRVAQVRLPKWEDLVGSRMRPKTGGMRGRSATPAGPSAKPTTSQDRLWSVDVAAPGNWCALDPATLGLWRANTTATAQAQLAAGADSATVTWAVGQAEANWPAAPAARDGGVYTLRAGTAPAAVVVVHRVAAGASTADLAKTLADKGCLQQLAILLEG